MKDIMIDIETLSTATDAAVIAVGAIAFDPMQGALGARFYAKILPTDAQAYGRTCDDTLAWWSKQDPAAREEAFSGTMTSRAVCEVFAQYLGQFDGVRVWGNGSTFDITILETLFEAHELPVPWKFWNVRDVRTAVDMGERLRGFEAKRAPFKGMAHKALDDAEHQARYVTKVFEELQA